MSSIPVARSNEVERGEVRVSPSRRALLAGGLGAVGAWAAGLMGRSATVRAADGDPILIGATNSATSTTVLENTTDSDHLLTVRSAHDGGAIAAFSMGSGTAILGTTVNGTAIHAMADSGNAVSARSTLGEGVHASSGNRFAVYGSNSSTDTAAIHGTSPGTGVSGSGGRTGVLGTGSKKGVSGSTAGGWAIHGKAPSGYAGYFEGKVFTNASYQLAAATGTKRATIFLRPSAGGHAQLCVRFNNGVVRVLATD